MIKLKVFEVYGNSDTTEGRGPMVLVARFIKRELAEEFVRSKEYANWCVMGYQNPKDEIKNIKEAEIVIFELVSEIGEVRKTALKQSALSKLTKEEKEALGL